MTALSDAELLVAARSSDEAAFTELYVRHHAAAQRLAQGYRRLGEPDDLVNGAFERVLAALRRGSGPTDSFRAYLFVTLRRLAMEQAKHAEDESLDEVPEPVAAVVADPELEEAERGIIAQAFESLPGQWQTVLWQTAVEGKQPKDFAGTMGMTPNAAAALAYRARERLRQAYLQAHLQQGGHEECEPHRSRLGSYVRGGLSRRQERSTRGHLAQCESCSALVSELRDVNRMLVRTVAPIFLLASGGPLAGGLASGGSAVGGASALTGAAASVAADASGAGSGAGVGSAGSGAGVTAAGAGAGAEPGAPVAGGLFSGGLDGGRRVGAMAAALAAAAVALVALSVTLLPHDGGPSGGGAEVDLQTDGGPSSEDEGPSRRRPTASSTTSTTVPGGSTTTAAGAGLSTTTTTTAAAGGGSEPASPPSAGSGSGGGTTATTAAPGVTVDAGVGVGVGVDAGGIDAQAQVDLRVSAAWQPGLLGSGTLEVEVANQGQLTAGDVTIDVTMGAGAGISGPTVGCVTTPGDIVGSVTSLLRQVTCPLLAIAGDGSADASFPLLVTLDTSATVTLSHEGRVVTTRTVRLA